jgi:hypothetical protein
MLLLWDNRKTFPTYLSNTKNTRARAVLDSYIVHISVSSYIYCLYTYSTYTYRLDRRVKSSIVFFFFFFFGDGVSIYVDGWICPMHVCVVCCAGCYIYAVYSVFIFYLRGFRKECTTASLLVCVCV